MSPAVQPFRPHPPDAPQRRFLTLPLSGLGFLLFPTRPHGLGPPLVLPLVSRRSRSVRASPFPSRLATTSGRFGFVILRTGCSPPVASHPASRRRSYVRLSAGERMPRGDSHPPDRGTLSGALARGLVPRLRLLRGRKRITSRARAATANPPLTLSATRTDGYPPVEAIS